MGEFEGLDGRGKRWEVAGLAEPSLEEAAPAVNLKADLRDRRDAHLVNLLHEDAMGE